VLVLVPWSMTAGQAKSTTATREVKASALVRNEDFERAVSSRRMSEEARLGPEAKRKLSLATDSVILRLARTSTDVDVSAVASKEVHRQFASISTRQSDILTFFVLAGVAKVVGDKDALKNRLDSMSEMSEMTSMRLQMAMDRRSRLMEAISNVMQKTSDTDGEIVKNIK
jgi:hypothetical protein